ncbi:hypothetical protein ACIRQP_35575 [Streptomyces sp. NPDC102274]|uniref:hypothetical protein n=1 Tax=Streptomyces sp. NPDC102274 TaxID=3366151 RepID=UPI0038302262
MLEVRLPLGPLSGPDLVNIAVTSDRERVRAVVQPSRRYTLPLLVLTAEPPSHCLLEPCQVLAPAACATAVPPAAASAINASTGIVIPSSALFPTPRP